MAKAHPADADPDALLTRLRIAAHPSLRTSLLAPLPLAAPGHPAPHLERTPSAPAPAPSASAATTPALLAPLPGGRLVSLWPYGAPVAPDERDAVPWEALGGLLARLHRVPVDTLPGPVPPMYGPAKVARALRRLRAAQPAVARSSAARAVHAAARALPDWARGDAPAPAADRLCHGDLHLGQLVRLAAPDDLAGHTHSASPPHGPSPTAPAAPTAGRPGTAGDGWLLIDVDDLGTGDPAWDLARPAAWFATGLLDPDEWNRLLDSYRAAGGPAAGPAGDPWPHLDVPARALTVQSAALGLVKAASAARALDLAEEAMVAACARMVGLPEPPPQAPPTAG
ncbi:phosphotransferase [Streptomyces sp. 796.1]|uniref:phosphotransferase n=1 Tax=Streptomyces sp. 796.1 TaxID=3163029 RepID=UPI0039C9778F